MSAQDGFLNDAADVPLAQAASTVAAEQDQANIMVVCELDDALGRLALQERICRSQTGCLQTVSPLAKVSFRLNLAKAPLCQVGK
jgi:hypothetical protein